MAHDVVDDGALRKSEKLADAGHDDMTHGGFLEYLLQHMREILEDHDDFGTRIVQLMLEFARGVQRVRIHDGATGAQCAEYGNRILQRVQQHDRDAAALAEACNLLQPGAERRRARVELGVSHLGIHLHVGDAIAVLPEALVCELLQ